MSWPDERCIVAAPGPSLTPEVAHRVRMARWTEGWRLIVVNDAYRRLPVADILYGCDETWWDLHKGCPEFHGERWSSHEQDPDPKQIHGNDKGEAAVRYGLTLVRGQDGDEFSFCNKFIRYGSNAGFQAINLALLKGCNDIVLVGFDMRHVAGLSHFFGDHPAQLRRTADEGYRGFARHFERAARALPADVFIVNATPGSALKCFPILDLEEALNGSGWESRPKKSAPG